MDASRLDGLLRLCHDPRAAPSAARQAEAELRAFGRTGQALQWALHTLLHPTADLHALFFAATVADSAALYRWCQLDAAQQDAVRECLWRCATEPGRPQFVVGKAAASLAHLLATEWPSGWPALQACLADQARVEAGVELLAATLEHFHSLSQTTSFGWKGKVLSASIPAIQAHYRELQPVALATLCSLLQRSSAGAPRLAARALRALRCTLADASQLPSEQGVTPAAVVSLLFECVAAAAAEPSGGPGEAAAVEVAAAALDCAADLQAKYFSQQEAQAMLAVLLPRLQDTCALVQQRWVRGQQAGSSGPLDDDPLPPALVRLLVQTFTTQLSVVDASPALSAALRSLLAQLHSLSLCRRSAWDLVLFLEAWHAVLSHLDSFEEALWDAPDDPEAVQRVKAATAAYKEPILAVCDVALDALCPAGAGAPAPPFSLDTLCVTPGSGTALDDWLQAAVAGGDGGGDGNSGDEERAAEAAGDEEDEVAAGGAAAFAAASEADVFARHAEGFLARAVGTFSAERLPWVLQRFQHAAAGFAAACQAAGEGAAHRGVTGAAAALGQHLGAFRSADVMLRLLTRCGPSLPTRGAGEPAAPLAPGEPVSGAHAVQCMRALCQLADAWLGAVRAVAAAAQPAGQPSTPAPLSAGGGAALAAMLQAGGRLHRALGALAATWLSQLFAGLAQGRADPDAAPVARQLAHGGLAAGAGLLAAAVDPALAGWAGALRDAASWAAEALVSLTSVALSGSLRPPPELLSELWGSHQAQALRQTAAASLASPGTLPLRASRALWLSLSDLALRCWPAQPPGGFDAAARSAAFAGLAAPLLQVLQQAAASVSGGGGLRDEAAVAARCAAAAAACVVQSYSGSAKALRGVVAGSLVGPVLPAAVAVLHAAAGGGGSAGAKAAAALLRLVEAALEVVATELGADGVEQLLAALVQVFGAAGGDPSFESDLLLLQLVGSLLSQGGAQRHAGLVLPALRLCLAVWDRASAAPAEAGASHARAEALAAALRLLRHRWRALAGGRPPSAGAGAGRPSSLAGAAAAAAAAQQQQQQQQGEAEPAGEGPAAVLRVLELLVGFFEAAAAGGVVLAAADVRLVLEELFELQAATRLYSQPLFAPARAPLAAALLCLLLSRLYGAAQEALGDTLFGLAASNWTEFHLAVAPRAVERQLAAAGVGGGERGALLALWGAADLDAHTFERALLAFLNDAAYYERAAA